MKQSLGFTLIELMVVIVIIGILAGLVLSAAGSISLKSQIKNTQGTILVLTSACEQYYAVYNAYPNLDYPGQLYNTRVGGSTATQSVSGTTTSDYNDAHYREFNKRLRFILEDRIYEVDEVRYGPFVSQSLPKTDDPTESATSRNKSMYADAWDNFLRVCPGRDHTADSPRGPNNLAPDVNKTNALDNKRRVYFAPDIFSIGPNGENEVDKDSVSSQQKTKFDTTLSGYDDIVNWISDIKYSERNYMRKMQGE